MGDMMVAHLRYNMVWEGGDTGLGAACNVVARFIFKKARAGATNLAQGDKPAQVL